MKKALAAALQFMVVILLFSTTTIAALTPEQTKVINSGVLDFNVEETLFCSNTNGNTTSSNKSVYLIGDSWLVRLLESSPGIESELKKNGHNVVGTNGVVGRSINGGTQSGLEALEQDTDIIKQADTIVVILGTNQDNYASAIPTFIEKIRGGDIKSNANIYWVNTSATAPTAEPSASNQAIQNNSITEGKTNYSVIDWYSVAFPGGDPLNVDKNLQSDLMDNDKLHPKISEGTTKLSEFIASSVGSGGSTITNSFAASSGGDITLNYGSSTYVLRSGWREIMGNAAARFGIDANILAGILLVETGWPDPATVESEQIRNSATATGPFQILDDSGTDIQNRVVQKVGETGTDRELDGTLILDGNKDGVVDRHNPWDAALMSAAYIKLIGGVEGLPIGSENDPLGTAAQEMSAGTNTIKKVLAHYNQGPNWTSNNPVQGNNNVNHYMVLGGEGYLATKNANWFFGAGGVSSPGCSGNNTGTQVFTWPVTAADNPSGRITSCWADLRHKTVSGGSYLHSGVDIAAARDTDVVAVKGGSVVYASDNNATYGGLVIIDHQNGVWSHYGHLNYIDDQITKDATVTTGQLIGGVGNTGISLGDHLHLNFYDKWPFGENVFSSNGEETINPLTNGLQIPDGVSDEANCKTYPNGGREVDIEL